MDFFISGYGDGTSSTLKLYHNDQVIWKDSIPNPSFLCQTDTLLFAAGEFDSHSSITSYRKTNMGYRKISILHIEGKQLCHLSLHKKQRLIVGSCWGSGTFFTVFYHSDGTFGNHSMYKVLPDKKGEISRFHASAFCKNWLFTANMGMDQIICFDIESGICREYSRLNFPRHSGPRHLLLHSHRDILYCITEDSSQLFAVDIQNPGSMKILFYTDLTSPRFSGKCYGSSIAATKSFSDLYAANRGENTIVHFHLDYNGIPEFSHRFSCHGNWPRHLTLLECDSYLAVANQKSNEAVFLRRSPDSGMLSNTPIKKDCHPDISFICEQF